MRLMRLSAGIVASICLAVTPRVAAQHGPHVVPAVHPTPPVHATPPAHSAAPAKAPIVHPPPFLTKLDGNTALVTRLTPLLPPGVTLNAAAMGFRNQGQFIAALHASKNLNIPFADLKMEMTGADHDSLGHAIHELKPGVDAKTAAKTAEGEAKTDIDSTRVTPPKPPKPAAPKGGDHDADDK